MTTCINNRVSSFLQRDMIIAIGHALFKAYVPVIFSNQNPNYENGHIRTSNKVPYPYPSLP